jgi:hypothetical protein
MTKWLSIVARVVRDANEYDKTFTKASLDLIVTLVNLHNSSGHIIIEEEQAACAAAVLRSIFIVQNSILAVSRAKLNIFVQNKSPYPRKKLLKYAKEVATFAGNNQQEHLSKLLRKIIKHVQAATPKNALELLDML